MSHEQSISKDDVLKVAALARLHLKDEEAQSLTEDLKGILGYIEKLKELDVTNVPPTSHALPLKNVYREDKVISLLSQEEALKMAVERKGNYFKVPKVIE